MTDTTTPEVPTADDTLPCPKCQSTKHTLRGHIDGGSPAPIVANGHIDGGAAPIANGHIDGGTAPIANGHIDGGSAPATTNGHIDDDAPAKN
jgi:hypothetical protein